MKKVWNKFLMFRTLNFRNKDELLPIPKHLKQIFLPIGKFIEDYEVTGKIICECGNDYFKIKIIGDDTNYQIDKIIQTIEIDGDYFLVVKAECNSCKKEYLIFDNTLHGHDGLFGVYSRDIIRPLPKLWCCDKCQSTNHLITAFFQSEGKADFEETHENEFERDDWTEAFGWILIKIQCKNCGETNNEWVSLETA